MYGNYVLAELYDISSTYCTWVHFFFERNELGWYIRRESFPSPRRNILPLFRVSRSIIVPRKSCFVARDAESYDMLRRKQQQDRTYIAEGDIDWRRKIRRRRDVNGTISREISVSVNIPNVLSLLVGQKIATPHSKFALALCSAFFNETCNCKVNTHAQIASHLLYWGIIFYKLNF